MTDSLLSQATLQLTRGLHNSRILVFVAALLSLFAINPVPQTPSSESASSIGVSVLVVSAIVGTALWYYLLSWIKTWVEQVALQETGNNHYSLTLDKTHRTLMNWSTAFQVFIILALISAVSDFFDPAKSLQNSQLFVSNCFFVIQLLIFIFLLSHIRHWSKSAFSGQNHKNESKKLTTSYLVCIVFTCLYTLFNIAINFAQDLSIIQMVSWILLNILSIYYIFIQFLGRNWIIALANYQETKPTSISSL